MRLQNLNPGTGGYYFLHCAWPIFVLLNRGRWCLSSQVPGFREAFMLEQRDRTWLSCLHKSRRLLASSSLREQRFLTRRDALYAWQTLVAIHASQIPLQNDNL